MLQMCYRIESTAGVMRDGEEFINRMKKTKSFVLTLTELDVVLR